MGYVSARLHHGIAPALVAAALCSCRGPEPLVPASASEAKLRVFFAPATYQASDPDCRSGSGQGLADAVRSAAEAVARSAGYVVVADQANADLVAKLGMTISYCSQYGGSYAGSAVMAVQGDGRVLVNAVAECTNGNYKLNECAQIAGTALVNAVTKSDAVASFARSPRAEAVASSASAAPSARAEAKPETKTAATPFVAATPQPAAWAVVVGIEKYRDVPPPTGARRDAEQFAELLSKTLGVPSDHVRVALDDRATRSDIEKALEWVKASAPAGSRVYFYFSGHGAPDPSTGTSFVLPYDGDPKYLDGTALRLQSVLAKLQESQAKEVLAVVDSCFSGAGGRSVLPAGTRPLVRVQAPTATAKLALFSAASDAEISGQGSSGGGAFTEALLKALGSGLADANGDGLISLGELRDWVAPRVQREAMKENRAQTPSLILAPSMGAPESFAVAWGFPPK